MAIDPVCEMEVDEKKATKVEYQGKTYYFCSERCKRDFQERPEQFVRSAA